MNVPISAPARVEPPAASDLDPAVAADRLSYSYGHRRALSGVSFSVARGEIFGFLGPNGGGKTTLFRLVSTLIPLQSGAVRLLGCDLAHQTAELRRRIGVVFQHPSLDGKLTVSENLAHHGHLYGLKGRGLRQRTAEMLKRLGISDRANDLVETLSGGQRRRVELAKSLLPKPELLLLDEPTTGLDPTARREFVNYLDALRSHEAVTIVLTTHQLDEAERCDRIGMLDQGALVAIAPPAELRARLGGDVIVIRARRPEALKSRLGEEFSVACQLMDGTLRVERPRGHELVREVVETFGPEIESISLGKPTLEDVFVDLTGHRFFSSTPDSKEAP